MVVRALFNAVTALYTGACVAKKMSSKLTTTNIASATISVVLNILLIKYLGLYTATLSMAIAFAPMTLWRSLDVRKYVKITYDTKSLSLLFIAHVTVIRAYYIKGDWLNAVGLIIAFVSIHRLSNAEVKRITYHINRKLKKDK